MAQLDVEPKKNNDWWKWLLGIVVLAIIIWVIVEATGTDNVDDMDDIENMDTTTTPMPETTYLNPETDFTLS